MCGFRTAISLKSSTIPGGEWAVVEYSKIDSGDSGQLQELAAIATLKP
jgi:hypothetical protein